MKRKSVLEKQTIRRRDPKKMSGWIRILRSVFSLTVKAGLLLTAIAGISFLFLYMYQYLISSPYLKLEHVSVTGVEQDLGRELIKISELETGRSLLTVNLKKIKTRMEDHSWVRSVDLEKKFPHTLIVHVEKEMPCALVALDRMFYMNSRGDLFKELEDKDSKDYPVITGISGEEQTKSLHMAARIIGLLKSNSGAWSVNDLSEIHFNKEDNISLYTMSMPAVIRIGSSELALKGDELKKIVQHLTKTGRIHMVKSIDLNYGNGAVVSFRDSNKQFL